MSAKKRAQTERVEKPRINGSRIGMDPGYRGSFMVSRISPLDAEILAEEKMQAVELKAMRLEEMSLKRRAKMVKLQKEIDKLEKDGDLSTDNENYPGISIGMAQQISHLSEEEQQKILQTYATFRSIDQSKGRRDPLLPLLVGFSKTNPGNSQSDMITYAKAMSDQFKTGIDAMKAVMPQREKTANSIEVLKLFKDLVSDSLQKPMDELVRKVQHQPGVFEQILTNPDLYNRAKEIGMFGSREPKGGSTNIDLEIEKMRGERQMSSQKLDLEYRKMMLEMESKDRRTERMVSLIGPLSAMFSGSVDDKMRALGRNTAATHNPGPVTVVPATFLHITCTECGYDENMPLPGDPPDNIACPGCGVTLNVGASKSGDT